MNVREYAQRRPAECSTWPRVRALTPNRIARAFGLHASDLARGFERMDAAVREAKRAHETFLEAIREQVQAHAEELAEQLRRDGTLYGEAHVMVGWDDVLQAPTIERIPPEQITPSA